MSGSLRPLGAAIVVILALTSAGIGPLGAAQFAARVVQVEVYTTVTGPDGAAVKDLSRDDFTVLEDGVPQKLTTFAAGSFPAAVFSRAIVTRAGSFRWRCAIDRIRAGIVAEKSAVWRVSGPHQTPGTSR